MKIAQRPDISNLSPDDIPTLIKFVAIGMKNIYDALANKLSFADNFDGQIIDVSFTSANAETVIAHNLGRVPVGYSIQRSNAAAALYDSGGSNWTKTTLYLKASAVSNVTIMVF